LWQILLQNDFERVVTQLLFKEAMDDARFIQVARPLGFDCCAFVIVRLDRRDLVWINVAENPTAEWIARQITEAFPWDDARNTSFVIGIGKIRARPAVFESRIQNAITCRAPFTFQSFELVRRARKKGSAPATRHKNEPSAVIRIIGSGVPSATRP
jgi:hypothetical protein